MNLSDYTSLLPLPNGLMFWLTSPNIPLSTITTFFCYNYKAGETVVLYIVKKGSVPLPVGYFDKTASSFEQVTLYIETLNNNLDTFRLIDF